MQVATHDLLCFTHLGFHRQQTRCSSPSCCWWGQRPARCIAGAAGRRKLAGEVLGGGDPGDKVMGEESWQGEVLGEEILAGKVVAIVMQTSLESGFCTGSVHPGSGDLIWATLQVWFSYIGPEKVRILHLTFCNCFQLGYL